ncbi:TPA: hypothetical protein ACH3X2_009218 [Trebouxia sp. C0005]
MMLKPRIKQLEHCLQMQNRQVESLSTSLKQSRAETACLNKEMMRQFAHFKSFRSQHSQKVVDAAQLGELRSRCARQEAEAATMTNQISMQKAAIAEGNTNLKSQVEQTQALAAHARGLSEANEELVDQRIDLMVQLAHLKAFLSNADKHERKLRAELRRAWLGHQAFEEALHFLLLLIQQACQQLQAALESHSPAARAAAAEDADHNPAACNEAQKPGVDKTVVDLIADSCAVMVAKEEEDTVHHDDDDDDKEDDDDDDKEDEATQKSYSNRLQATTGETKSTCGFLGSLLRWSNKRQLDAKESVQPSTSKQKEDTPMLSDVQGLHDMADAVRAVLELLNKARHVKPRVEKRAKPGSKRRGGSYAGGKKRQRTLAKSAKRKRDADSTTGKLRESGGHLPHLSDDAASSRVLANCDGPASRTKSKTRGQGSF